MNTLDKSHTEVVKANGTLTPFDPDKLYQSLLRSGADPAIASGVVDNVIGELHAGISTRKIYRKAFSLLKKSSGHVAARYNLKSAIMELGPSGYPFERYVGKILEHQGYSVQVAQIVEGLCVNHEVDVIAEKDDHHFMIECKYHNEPGTVSDVKIPLYIQSRFKDVEAQWKKLPGHHNKTHQGWVVTNTRFTIDAIKYGRCAGLKLLGWDYPLNGGLRQIIDETGLYPLTCLTSITGKEKRALLQLGVVLCHELCSDKKLLESVGIKQPRIETVLTEGRELCKQMMAGQAVASK